MGMFVRSILLGSEESTHDATNGSSDSKLLLEAAEAFLSTHLEEGAEETLNSDINAAEAFLKVIDGSD